MFKKYELTIYEIGIIKILFFVARILASANNNENVYSHQISELEKELLSRMACKK